MRIRTLISSALHTQTDGQTEKMHRILAQMLRALLFQDQPELGDEKLPYMELAINFATNATVWKPEFELLYGDNIVFPIDLPIGTDTTHP